MSPIGLADRLDITKAEAIEMTNTFFTTFPGLKEMFETDAAFGAKNFYIEGLAPISRRRYFPYPVYKSDIGSIERKSKNFPIQAANADILKVALVELRKRIRKENLPVKLHLPIHDEVLSSAATEFSEEWLEIQEEIMIQAASVYLDTSLVTVDSKILTKWEK